MNQHATALEWNNTGILLVGPSGCGKSELAFQLMGIGATLVADDQVLLTQENNQWIARCPDSIRGKIHLHDLGILSVPHTPGTIIKMIFQSDKPAERLSQAPAIDVPIITLDFTAPDAAKTIFSKLG